MPNNMDELLCKGETVEELGIKGMRIIQAAGEYRFTSDAVILANLVKANAASRVVDLGSGSGIIALLIAAKTKAAKITGIELQPKLAERSRRSVKLNRLESRVNIVTANINGCSDILGCGGFDVVVSNPPYYRTGEGETSDNLEIALCRHEIALSLSQLISEAAKLVKFGGKFYIIFKADRLCELMCGLCAAGLEPKELICIQPAKGKTVDTVVIVAKRGAEKGITIKSFVRAELEHRLYGKEQSSHRAKMGI